MDKKQKSTEELQKNLFSKNEDVVLKTIDEIRNIGNLTIIPLLFDLLATENSDNIQNSIINCLADIKDNLAEPIFIDALNDTKYSKIKNHILYCMWQSTIDYSEYASKIIGIICNDSLETIIEATTVLDNIAPNINKRDRDFYIERLSAAAKENVSPIKDLILQSAKILASINDFRIEAEDL